MDWWMLVLAAIAAIAGVWLLVLAWIDRPKPAWELRWARTKTATRMTISLRSVTLSAEEVTRARKITVRLTGSGAAHNVELRHHGGQLLPPADMFSPHKLTAARMTADSSPLTLDVLLPEDSTARALIEVAWDNLRPARRQGWRWDLRGPVFQVGESWHWQWTSIRWVDGRLRRTAGEWRIAKPRLHPGIPEPVLEAARPNRSRSPLDLLRRWRR